MTGLSFDGYNPTWCPGCGDWAIRIGLKSALLQLADQFIRWSDDYFKMFNHFDIDNFLMLYTSTKYLYGSFQSFN